MGFHPKSGEGWWDGKSHARLISRQPMRRLSGAPEASTSIDQPPVMCGFCHHAASPHSAAPNSAGIGIESLQRVVAIGLCLEKIESLKSGVSMLKTGHQCSARHLRPIDPFSAHCPVNPRGHDSAQQGQTCADGVEHRRARGKSCKTSFTPSRLPKHEDALLPPLLLCLSARKHQDSSPRRLAGGASSHGTRGTQSPIDRQPATNSSSAPQPAPLSNSN